MRQVALLLFFASSPALAADWYVGASAGLAIYQDFGVADFDDGSFVDSMGDPTPRSEDTNAIGLRVFGGLDLPRGFSVEFGYSDFGEASAHSFSNGGGTWSAGRVSGTAHYSGLDASALSKWPVSENVSLGARLGAVLWMSDVTARDDTNPPISADDDGIDPVFGVMGEWNLGKIALRGDLTRYNMGIDALTISLIIRPESRE